MQRQPPNYQHGEVSKRFGSHNGLSVTQKQNTVPKEPRVVFLHDQAPGTQRVLPPPRARAAPVSLAGYLRGHGSLGRYLSAQAKNSVGRAPTRNPNHNLTPSNQPPTPTEANIQTNTTDDDRGATTIAREFVTVTLTLKYAPNEIAVPSSLHVPVSQTALSMVGKGARPCTPTRHRLTYGGSGRSDRRCR